MTGIDDPYEPPARPELVFDEGTDAALAAAEIELHLQHRLAVTA
jgi:adenylylsulfate kinase-like enzyme